MFSHRPIYKYSKIVIIHNIGKDRILVCLLGSELVYCEQNILVARKRTDRKGILRS